MTKKNPQPSEIEPPASPVLEPTPAPAKRSHHKKVTGDKLSYEELQQKLARTFNFIAFLLKSDKVFTESDFIEEAKDLTRISTKYELVNMALTFLDPLFFLFGIFAKGKEMLKDRPAKKGKDETPTAGSERAGLSVINS